MLKYSIILLTTICQRTFFSFLGIGQPTDFLTLLLILFLFVFRLFIHYKF